MSSKRIESISKPRVAPDLVWENKDDSWLVVDIERPSWAVINSTGREIVKLCDGKNTLAEIVESLSKIYEQNPDDIYKDVLEFVEKLKNDEIVYFGQRRNSKLRLPEAKLRELLFEITNNCNLRCIHCYLDAAKPKLNELTTPDILEVVDRFVEMGGQEICFTGGEPLIRNDIEEILEYTFQKNITIKLITNGILINSHIAKVLVRLGVYVQLSVDGVSSQTNDCLRGKGAFGATKRGLECLFSEGAERVAISVTPTKINLDEIPALIEMAANMGATFIHFSRLSRQGRADNNWEEICLSDDEEFSLYQFLIEQGKIYKGRIRISGNYVNGIYARLSKVMPRSIGCSLGDSLRIDCEGNIYPCSKLYTHDYLLGNSKEIALGEAMQRLEQIRALFFERLNKIETCRTCKWKYFCGGGCMADALLVHGTIWEEDPRCQLRRRAMHQYAGERMRGDAS